MPMYNVRARLEVVNTYHVEANSIQDALEIYEDATYDEGEGISIPLSVEEEGQEPKPARQPKSKPRRKRRTKAEIAAAKAAEGPTQE